MPFLNYSVDEINKILDGRLHSPIEDIVGDDYTSASPLSMTAGTEYRFICNGNLRNFKNFPDHITEIWNSTASLATFSEFLDTPEMVSNIQFDFDPDAAAAGTLTLKIYVNETVPILLKSYTVSYKALADRYTILGTFYIGEEIGFDVKNKGIFYTISSSANGELFDPALEIYRT